MSYETILFDVDADGVATLTLNRPEKRNAWNRQMGLEIRSALKDADARDDVRVVVVTGAGKDFCVGADLEGAGKVFEQARDGEAAGQQRLTLKAWDVRKPIIGALNGDLEPLAELRTEMDKVEKQIEDWLRQVRQADTQATGR